MSNKKSEVPLYGVVDERTKSVVYQGDAYAGRFMMFALLIDVVLRSFQLNDPLTTSNWDLMLIVGVGGIISTVFQSKHKILLIRPFSRSFKYIAMILGIAALVSIIATKLM